MLHNFTLYNVLVKEAENTEMSAEEKINMSKLIKKIDIEGCEFVYAIIRCYQIERDTVDQHVSSSLPYEGKMTKTCIKWDMDKFPNDLLRIIELFLKKHILKMNEEKVLRQTRKNTKKNEDNQLIEC
jgi:hypothetical protein